MVVFVGLQTIVQEHDELSTPEHNHLQCNLSCACGARAPRVEIDPITKNIYNLYMPPSPYTTFNIFDYIGHYGPVILFITTFFAIFEQKSYLYAFVLFSFLNIYFNKFLKIIIRQSRPPDQIQFIDYFTALDGEEQFGMPSGHAQTIAFQVIYLYLVKSSNFLLLFSLFIYSITMYQRWKFKKHTIEQLCVGSIIGAAIAYLTYHIVTKYLHFFSFQTYKNHI